MGRRDLQSPLILFFLVGSMVSPCQLVRPKRADWFNPCQYLQRNRTVRETRALTNQINLAINEFRKINSTIMGTYDSASTRPNNRNKFNTSSSLLHFYRDFYAFGRKVEDAINMQVDTQDGGFHETNRCRILGYIKNSTIHVMCEMYDVLKRKKRFKKSFLRKPSNVKEPTKIRKKMSLTEAIMIDSVLYDTYYKLLRAVKKTADKRRANRSHNSSNGGAKHKRRMRKNKAPKKT